MVSECHQKNIPHNKRKLRNEVVLTRLPFQGGRFAEAIFVNQQSVNMVEILCE